MRNGRGRFYYQDGGYYEGQWKNNKMDGFGKLYYEGGKLAYEGQWFVGIPSMDLMLVRLGVTHDDEAWSPEEVMLRLRSALGM